MKKEHENDFEFIVSYFDLELTDQEKLLFEKKVKEDVSFAKKVVIYKESIEIVEEIDPTSEEKIREQEWRSIVRENKQTRVIQLRKIIGIAASLIIGFSLIFYFSSNNTDIDTLTQKAWSKNVGLDFVLRGQTIDSTKVILSEAVDLYENKQYNEILILLKEYSTSSSFYKDILLLRALSYHKLNQSKVALKTLDTLDSFSPDISKWYKGLIYLDEEDIVNAKLYIMIPNDSQEGIKLKK